MSLFELLQHQSAAVTSRIHNPSKIIAVEKSENRLAKAMEVGATHTINAGSEDVLKKIAEYTEGRGADVVIDAAGIDVTINQGFECMGINGRMFLVGIPAQPVSISPIHFFKNVSLKMGLGDLTLIEKLFDRVKDKSLDFTPLISHILPFNEIESAIDLVQNRPDEVIKVILKF